jgi:hypothetical protein
LPLGSSACQPEQRERAMTLILAEGIYAIGQTTLLKPENRAFSR